MSSGNMPFIDPELCHWVRYNEFVEVLITTSRASYGYLLYLVENCRYTAWCCALNVFLFWFQLFNQVTHLHMYIPTVQGRGLLSQFPPFRYFPNFSSLSNHTLTAKYRIYIWQVSPQLSCGDTCQIWMWFDESNMYFCETENFACGEINERSFSNPHPWQMSWHGRNCDLIWSSCVAISI